MAALHSISKGQLRMQLQEVAGPAVAIYPGLKVLGIGMTGVSLLSQAIYWTERTSDAGGWFYKSQEEWEQETGLSRSAQELARKKLVAIGVLLEKKKGVPCRLHYMVDTDELFAILADQKRTEQAQETCRQVCEKPAIQSAGKQQTSLQKTSKQASGKPAGKAAGNPQAITEITTETTAEITADILPALPAVAGSPAAEGELIEVGEEAQALAPVQLVTGSAGPRCSIPADMPGPKDQSCKTFKAWANYAMAYRKRYSVWPVWNAQAGGMLGKLIGLIGAEAAPKVAAFYVSINDARLVNDCHSLNNLIAKAGAYHTQWLTGRQMNSTTARQIEQTQANINAAEEAARRILERGERNEFL